MTLKRSSLRRGIVFAALIAFAACKGGTGGGAPCATTSDCGSGELCVTVGSDATCTLDCTASASACGASASCEGVGSVGISVCQPSQPAPSQQNPPSPAKQPKLSCSTDQECAAIHAGTVCGEWMGEHDCTIVCAHDSDCNPPAIGGFATTFFGCQADQGTSGRTVCSPRQQCFDDPASCVTFPGGGGTGGFPGTGSFPGSGGLPGM